MTSVAPRSQFGSRPYAATLTPIFTLAPRHNFHHAFPPRHVLADGTFKDNKGSFYNASTAISSDGFRVCCSFIRDSDPLWDGKMTLLIASPYIDSEAQITLIRALPSSKCSLAITNQLTLIMP